MSESGFLLPDSELLLEHQEKLSSEFSGFSPVDGKILMRAYYAV